MSNDGHSQATVGCPLSGPYAGLRAVLATMHGKDAAIVPVFQERLELSVVTPSAIDTDALGTFTGEIPRSGTISPSHAVLTHPDRHRNPDKSES